VDGDTGRHLDDGKQRIDSVERLGLHGNSHDGKGGHGGDHAWEVGGAAGASDDDLQATTTGGQGIILELKRRAVSAHDLGLKGDTQLLERVGGVDHRLPVGLRTHDDADQRCGGKRASHARSVS